MHNVVPNSRAYIAHCARRARRLGVDILVGVRATGLIVESGRVCGIRAKLADGKEVEYRQRGGVVLATGDYSASSTFKRDLISPSAADIAPINVNSTGDGHSMAMQLGGRILNGHLAHIGVRFLPPPRRSLPEDPLPASRMLARLIRIAMERLPLSWLRPFLMKFLLTVMEPSPTLFAAGAALLARDGTLIADWDGDRMAGLIDRADHTGYILFDAAIADSFEVWPNYIFDCAGIAYAYVKDYRRNRSDLFNTALRSTRWPTSSAWAGSACARL